MLSNTFGNTPINPLTNEVCAMAAKKKATKKATKKTAKKKK
jgi:hypothetical protein